MAHGFAIALTLFPFAAYADISYQSDGITLTGPLLQGGMVIGKVTQGATLKLEERAVRVGDDGTFVIGFGRNAPRTMELEVAFVNGSVSSHILEIARRQYATQRINNLAENTVTPPPKVYGQIDRDRKAIRVVRSRDTDTLFFLQSFDWPVHGIITGVYGVKRILNGKPRSPHYGIDIAAPLGTPVKTPVAGELVLIRDMYFSGITAVIDHGHGISSTFLHLDKVYAKIGTRVKKGQVIGTVGASGRATGPHLDWRVNWFEQRLDPQLLVDEMPLNDSID